MRNRSTRRGAGLRRAASFVIASMLFASPVFADNKLPDDPLRSPVWAFMAKRYLGDAPVVIDERVRVVMPASAEDPLAVPVDISADGLDGVEQVLVYADLNPLPKILEYFPKRAKPNLQFRFKVEQSTPVRAAMKTRDGVWHLGGAWLSAAGGGCTAPSMGTGGGLWHDQLGEVSGRIWPQGNGAERLRIRVIHPMDTGLAPGIPVFHIETLTLHDAKGVELAVLKPYEPVSENPMLSFDLQSQGSIVVSGRDIQGNLIKATVAAGAVK